MIKPDHLMLRLLVDERRAPPTQLFGGFKPSDTFRNVSCRAESGRYAWGTSMAALDRCCRKRLEDIDEQ